jgi:hypothetical protein
MLIVATGSSIDSTLRSLALSPGSSRPKLSTLFRRRGGSGCDTSASGGKMALSFADGMDL